MTEPPEIFLASGKCFLCGTHTADPFLGAFVGNHLSKAGKARVFYYRLCIACMMQIQNNTKRGRRAKARVERAWAETQGVQI